MQLKNDGNNEGEAANQPGVTSTMGDFPEIFDEARNFPYGRLAIFQRHKLAVWSIYNMGLGRFGDASISGLWRVNSGDTFSLRATGQPLTGIQEALLESAGYPDAPDSQTVYFDERGSETFKGYGVIDIGLGYNVPVFKTLRPYFRLDIYNALNNQKQIGWNTTVTQDPNSPTDALGLRDRLPAGCQFRKGHIKPALSESVHRRRLGAIYRRRGQS